MNSIHPSLTAHLVQVGEGGWSRSRLTLGESRVHLDRSPNYHRADRQTDNTYGPFRHQLTWTACLWIVRGSRTTRRQSNLTQRRTCKLHKKGEQICFISQNPPQSLVFQPRTSRNVTFQCLQNVSFVLLGTLGKRSNPAGTLMKGPTFGMTVKRL